MAAAVAEDRLLAMEAKLDAVSHQLDFIVAALREQRRDVAMQVERAGDGDLGTDEGADA
mgnify:CR=1 FL=1